jgi:hypothetical protein
VVVTLRELTDENRAAVLALRVALAPLEAAHRQAPPRPRLRLRGRPAGREARPSRGAIELLTSYVPEKVARRGSTPARVRADRRARRQRRGDRPPLGGVARPVMSREGAMDTGDSIALAALVVSVATAGVAGWRSWSSGRRAEVGAYFRWLESRAWVRLPSGEVITVGYHLVLVNRGPRRAEQVDVEVYRRRGSERQQTKLTDLQPGELPLDVLDPGGRYPIPWALGQDGLEFADDRRFEVEVTWRDRAGKQSRCIPLRRGNIGT